MWRMREVGQVELNHGHRLRNLLGYGDAAHRTYETSDARARRPRASGWV